MPQGDQWARFGDDTFNHFWLIMWKVSFIQWCNQDFFQDKDQDLNFKTKTKTLKFFQDQDFMIQDQDLFVMYTRGRKTARLFLQDRERDQYQMFKTKTKTLKFFQDQDQA